MTSAASRNGSKAARGRRFSARGPAGASVVFAALLVAAPAAAFDTRWHAEATAAAARRYGGFSPAAVELLQVGNFVPDFFGSTTGELEKRKLLAAVVAASPGFATLTSCEGPDGERLCRVAALLHFDDIAGGLAGVARFDAVFQALLRNTRNAINASATEANRERRRRAVLFAVGSSLHMVQDFYSHSNWIHHSFEPAVATNSAPVIVKAVRVKMATALPARPAVAVATLPRHSLRDLIGEVVRPLDLARGAWLDRIDHAPTWFEPCAKGPCFATLSAPLRSGVYPDSAATAMAKSGHGDFNHDSVGTMAHDHPTRSRRHDQERAVATAARASHLWLVELGKDEAVRAALAEAAQASGTPGLMKDVQGISCAVGHWDGPHGCPGWTAAKRQGAVVAHALMAPALSVSLELAALAGRTSPLRLAVGTVAALATAAVAADLTARYAVAAAGDVYPVYVGSQMLEALVQGFGDPRTGRYVVPGGVAGEDALGN